MISFKSNHYPKTGNAFRVMQESALRFYAIFTAVLMIAVLLRMNSGEGVLWFAIIGEGIALALGNLAASVSLRNKIAEIFFVQESFSLISISEIIYKEPNKSFPIRLANASRTENEIHIHFQDQVMVLKREDWEDFDVIWTWLNPD